MREIINFRSGLSVQDSIESLKKKHNILFDYLFEAIETRKLGKVYTKPLKFMEVYYPNIFVLNSEKGFLRKNFCTQNSVVDGQYIDPISLEPIDNLVVGTENNDKWTCYDKTSLGKYVQLKMREQEGEILDPLTKIEIDSDLHVSLFQTVDGGDHDMRFCTQLDKSSPDSLLTYVMIQIDDHYNKTKGPDNYQYVHVNIEDFTEEEKEQVNQYLELLLEGRIPFFYEHVKDRIAVHFENPDSNILQKKRNLGPAFIDLSKKPSSKIGFSDF